MARSLPVCPTPPGNGVLRWRVLRVDEHGDIDSENEFDSEDYGGPRKALAAAIECFSAIRSEDPWLLFTIEGWWVPNDQRRSDRFCRVGLVHGLPSHPRHSYYSRRDEVWYTSGDEPGFLS